MDGKIRVEGVLDKELDDNDRTATAANLTTLAGDPSNRSYSEDKIDFSAKNRPCPSLEKMLYNGIATSVEYAQDMLDRQDERPKKLSKQ